MSKSQIESLTKRADAQDAKIAKLEEINADLTEKIAALVVEPKKKPAKAKAKTEKVKVTAGAGAASDEEKPKSKKKKISDMSPIEKLEHDIEVSQKYINDESKPDAERKKRAAKLEIQRAQLRKLNGEVAADDEKKDDAPIEFSPEKLASNAKDLEDGDTPGVYWYAKEGKSVTGPPADTDEEFSEIDFEGTTYDVGDNTMRVYRQYNGAAANPDKEQFFMGYPGVGKFRKMKIAKDDE